ncbi:MAG: hypothetical protein QG567_184, partial [Campylobacterota bacterium]|nr:hypothetical protein [Campylobacterota bacterium]
MKALFFVMVLSIHICAQDQIVVTSDASIVTHKLTVGNVTIGLS